MLTTELRFLSSSEVQLPKSDSVSMETPTITASEGNVSIDPARIAAERKARIRLLKDLVQHGLYRIDTDQLASTLLDRHRIDLL